MYYQSTRGQAEHVQSTEAIIQGIAPDGGLYVPVSEIAPLAVAELPTDSYQNLAKAILKIFLTDFNDTEIEEAVTAAYNSRCFDHVQITPLKFLSKELAVMELWHGPTYAFKDIALQILPHLLTKAMEKRGEKSEVVILTATSGDTGKSALEGFRDVEGIRIIVFFPHNGVSEIQKLQMVTQEGGNVSVAAVEGNFDDTQNGVKEIFSNRSLSQKLLHAGYQLSSANSINWGRLLPQIVYYFKAYQDLIDKKVIRRKQKINFVVPTGNFGNILAGYYAFKLGLPVNRLICASNSNNVLTDFINNGLYNSSRELKQTLSPSMDILISSNLERLLFELTDRNSQKTKVWMEELKSRGKYTVGKGTLKRLQELFWADSADDRETLETIASVFRNYQYLVDTHTAVGLKVWEKYRSRSEDTSPTVILSTASPYKFAGSVLQAINGGPLEKDLTELEMLNQLARQTGTAVPINLADLEGKEIRHRARIPRDKMDSHLLGVLSV